MSPLQLQEQDQIFLLAAWAKLPSFPEVYKIS